jgi:Skp family chaperone for outer membrane proteins
MNSRKFYIVIIFLLLSIKSSQSENILYLDTSYIMNNSLAGKSIIDQINSKKKDLSIIFDKEENKLIEKETKLISQKNLLKAEEFTEKAKSLKEEINKYNLNKKEKVRLLNNKKIKAESELANNISIIVSEYATKNAVSFILHKNSIVIAKKDLEITSVITEILNKKFKKIDIK